ncbi:ATP-grasp domain-containing protein [Gemelliphila palaticanis]|uniref:ATP-grasp domain-containing protein n=1 Tax=Gemelliphila palaticanis TaxID=81950 RepID=A0ABX2T3C1_9BACL|nr:ATP-grasp domain-containing protein [Gemella palaticanis]MBF0716187.1 ATP-grasp domain-containing protein [Gemella palaticanis]NYS48117.1 ATP-grasp domain-containing protein [Gemella palaticanis]
MEKKLNFVMISPHFPKNYETFAFRMKESGINVLAVADVSYDELSDVLKSSLTEYYRVSTLENYDEVYRAIGYFAHKYGKIDRIESNIEYWLELDAKLRTDFNVFGLKVEDMEKIKTKSKMKEIFKANNIPVAKGRVFSSDDDARILSSELGFPVIVKPNSGVGASDTYKIKSKEDLECFFENKTAGVTYIMEEFIPGDVVTFDGLVDSNGKLVFYSSIIHNTALLNVFTDSEDMYFYLPNQIPKDLVAMGEKCVKAFGIKERFFHFEFFRTEPKGELMALEINCRPPGWPTIDMFNYANDIDIFKEYANIVLGNDFSADVTRPYNCVYISRKNSKDYKHNYSDIKEQYSEQLVDVLEVPVPFRSMLGDEGYVLRDSEIKNIYDIINYVREVKK